jgi:hypothetical protein
VGDATEEERGIAEIAARAIIGLIRTTEVHLLRLINEAQEDFQITADRHRQTSEVHHLMDT